MLPATPSNGQREHATHATAASASVGAAVATAAALAAAAAPALPAPPPLPPLPPSQQPPPYGTRAAAAAAAAAVTAAAASSSLRSSAGGGGVVGRAPLGLGRQLGVNTCWGSSLGQLLAASPGARHILQDASTASMPPGGGDDAAHRNARGVLRLCRILVLGTDGDTPLDPAVVSAHVRDLERHVFPHSPPNQQQDVWEAVGAFDRAAALVVPAARSAAYGGVTEQLVVHDVARRHGDGCPFGGGGGMTVLSAPTMPTGGNEGFFVIESQHVATVERNNGQAPVPWATADIPAALRHAIDDFATTWTRGGGTSELKSPGPPAVCLTAVLTAACRAVETAPSPCDACGVPDRRSYVCRRIARFPREFVFPVGRPPLEASDGAQIHPPACLGASSNGVARAEYRLVGVGMRYGPLTGSIGHWWARVPRDGGGGTRSWFNVDDATVRRLEVPVGEIPQAVAAAVGGSQRSLAEVDARELRLRGALFWYTRTR